MVCLHIDRERKLGAKGARHTQVAGIGPEAIRLGEELAPIFSFAASVIEAARPCLLKRMARRGSVGTPLSFRRSQKQSTRGAHQAPPQTKPSCASFLRASLSRPFHRGRSVRAFPHACTQERALPVRAARAKCLREWTDYDRAASISR